LTSYYKKKEGLETSISNLSYQYLIKSLIGKI